MNNQCQLSSFGKQLWTREKAAEIRERVEKELGGLGTGDIYTINLKGVEVFDFSFANELFGKLMMRMPIEYEGRFVVVEGLTKYTRENLEKALEALGVVMIERQQSSYKLIGKIHPTDEKTFDAVRKSGSSLASSQLAEKLEVNINAMNERLKKLLSLGLIRREKSTSGSGRVQYAYLSLK
jgi:hypothetical protein